MSNTTINVNFNDVKNGADIAAFTISLIPEGEGPGAYFQNAAREILAGAMSYCLITGKNTNLELNRVLRLGKNMAELFEEHMADGYVAAAMAHLHKDDVIGSLSGYLTLDVKPEFLLDEHMADGYVAAAMAHLHKDDVIGSLPAHLILEAAMAHLHKDDVIGSLPAHLILDVKPEFLLEEHMADGYAASAAWNTKP